MDGWWIGLHPLDGLPKLSFLFWGLVPDRCALVRSLVVGVLAFVVVAVPSVALADGRAALVVGNSTYAHIGRLPNPDNDARDMSAALRRLGVWSCPDYAELLHERKR